MAVLINFKICDNAKECGGIAVCPTGALSYDDEKKQIVIDNDKCVACGSCTKECPVQAIKVAKDEEEYKKLEKEINDDRRTIKDLFVDRYGAMPLSDFFIIDPKDIEEKSKTSDIVLIEAYNDDSIECLLKSIPIKELTEDLPDSTLFYKVEVDDEILAKYDIKELPSLLVFKKGLLTGHIDGYYSYEEKEKLSESIKEIVN